MKCIKYLIFLIIGIILFILWNNYDSFSVGVPFNIGDKVVIKPGTWWNDYGYDTTINARRGEIVTYAEQYEDPPGSGNLVAGDRLYVVRYVDPVAGTPIAQEFGGTQIELYNYLMYLRPVCAASRPPRYTE